ncbi:MAG: FtsW/RodA/SpoVE family cell cycle protein [Aerococcus sp.]|nr:FtsW/RodA/SpoVE family cell cycle protein [Aerococcus sp.]
MVQQRRGTLLSHSENKRKTHTVNTVDKTIVVAVIGLMLVSLVAIFSTTYLYNNNGSIRSTLFQGVWFVIGSMVAYLFMLVDKRTWYQWAPVGYFIGIFLLILVLLFYSRDMATLTGARSWFAVGSFSFQPSELMKFLYLVMMARLVSDYMRTSQDEHYSECPVSWQLRWDIRFIGRLLMWTLPPMVLIILQRDLGTTLVFLMIFVGIVFVSGINWRIILPVALILSAIFLILLFLVIYDREVLYHLGFKDYQFARIDSWLRPFENTRQESYQLSQSLKAIGSGQFIGKGLGKFEVYVPVRESDMIFATIGENFGFLGASVVLLLLFILLFQMIAIAYESYSSFFVTGVSAIVAMMTFHIVENVGMSMGLLPLTGIPLPFISQGGSAIVMNMMCIGFVLSIRYNEERSESEVSQRWIVRILRRLSHLPGMERFQKKTSRAI